MFSDEAVRDEDREEIFRTLLLHQNIDPQQNSWSNFGLLKKSESIQSLKTPSKSSLRKTSSVLKKLNRRGSVAVYHPARTSLVAGLSPLPVLSEEVSGFDAASGVSSNFSLIQG